MADKEDADDVSPYDKANLLSKLTFWWVTPLFRKGFRETLTLPDVSQCPKQDKSDFLLEKIDSNWEEQLVRYKSGKSASLFWCICVTFINEFLFPGFVMLLCESCRVVQPFIIGKLIWYFENDGQVSQTEAYVYAAILGLTFTCAVTSDLFHFYKLQHLSLKMKTAVGALIYKKILNLNSQSFHLTNSGKIANLLTTDLEKFNYSFETFHFLWICPIELVVVFYLLYRNIGLPCLSALIIIVLLLPVQIFCGQMFAKLRYKVGKWSDKRINKMNEILSGIKVIKMYCWEKPFHNVITNIRKNEVKFVKRSFLLKSLNFTLMIISPKLMGLIIFICVWWLGQPLSVHMVFTTVGWMLILQDSVFLFLFMAVENVMSLYSSLKRVQTFLLISEEKSMRNFKKVNKELVDKDPSVAIEMVTMTARWHISPDYPEKRFSRMAEKEQLLFENEMEKYFSLKNINLSVKKGELLAVVGQVGAGKTSLLMTIMGEIQHNKGQVTVYGDVSYSCQHSWVFSGTLKDNILLGEVYDEEKYQQVIQSTALAQDINGMTNGDLTLVGERGLFLSGGQKARLTLARCVYRDCDIYLLDDPLSSVDSNVGQHIFHQCIRGLLGNKTVVLVTHQGQYLKSADRILVLNQGKVSNIGSYEELLIQGVDFTGVVTEEEEEQTDDVEQFQNTEIKQIILDASDENDETCARNKISAGVYKHYFKAGHGFKLLPIFLISAILYKPVFFLADWSLAKWAQSYDDQLNLNRSTTANSSFNVSDIILNYNSGIPTDNMTMMLPSMEDTWVVSIEMKYYLICTAVFSVFAIIYTFTIQIMCVFASKNLHNQMFQHVLGATSRFFDSQPLGRIINRFSRDIGMMDDTLVRLVNINSDLFITIFGTSINICIIAPWLFIALVPICCVVIAIRYYAIRTTRDVRRLEAVAKSPVFCHVSDTVIGLQTIRVSGKQKQFAEDFNRFQNVASGAWFTYLSSYRWFSMRSLAFLIVFLNVVIWVTVLVKNDVPSGLLGLTLTYLMSFAMPFEFFIRMTAELENNMTAVERVLSYTTVKQEATRTSDKPPPEDWPSQGSISFSDVYLKYDKDSPVVLKNINLHIRSKEKIGIVGRTGAGKSSLLAALFRLAEPEGNIWIDGWDILQIGLDELRKKISVIPQDPVLFSGTLRYNLDPFDEYSDDRLWNALEQVQLKDKVSDTPDNLYMEMSESGHNFSVGQRQLVCLARALLRYNTILVIDEATAHVDRQTDELIQGTLRAKFLDSTVLTIAHRLHTIMDCDRIIVLDNGEVKEFDTPYNLLQDDEGVFTNLVEQTGQQQAAELRHMAKIANNTRASASMLLDKAVQKANRHLSNSHSSLNKSIKSRNSIHRKDSQRRSRPDLDTTADINKSAHDLTLDSTAASSASHDLSSNLKSPNKKTETNIDYPESTNICDEKSPKDRNTANPKLDVKLSKTVPRKDMTDVTKETNDNIGKVIMV